MKKVFLMAALVLACTAGSKASAMNETVNEAIKEASNSELMPVKKTTKKSSSKKTTTKKTTSTKKTTTSSTNSSAATTTATTPSTATTATSTNATTTSSNGTSAASAIAGVLGGLLGGSTSSSSSSTSTGSSIINGILNNVIGSSTFKQADLCANTWKYSKPGCAFTSENLLAKAGGEIAANKIETDLSKYYTKFGFTSSNTYITFSTDGTFSAKIDGKAWNGTYTFDEKTHAIQLKGRLLLSISGFATRTTNGISLLFEQKKLLTLIQTLSKFSGSSTLSAVGSIASNYDGVRIGFEMTK